MRKNRIINIIILIFLFQSFVFGQSNERNNNIETINTSSCVNIMGKVIDEKTGEGVEGVKVKFLNIDSENGRAIYTKTDKKGNYIFEKMGVVKGFEYELIITAGCNDIYLCNEDKYFRQTYLIKFKLKEGKNLILDTIKLKRGKRVKGVVKLRNGKKVKNFLMQIILKDRKPFDAFDEGWDVKNLGDGKFHSELLPVGEELYFVVTKIIDEEGTVYYAFEKLLKIEEDKNYDNLKLINEGRGTEIVGRITDINGKPIKGKQRITITPDNSPGISLVANKDGYFRLKDIDTGKFKFDLALQVNNRLRFFGPFKDNNKLFIKKGERMFLDIKFDELKNKIEFRVKTYRSKR